MKNRGGWNESIDDGLYARTVEESRRQGFDPARIEKTPSIPPPSGFLPRSALENGKQ